MKIKHYVQSKKNRLKSITNCLFITAQVFALLWVSSSYIMAAYATFALQQPYPVETLSGQAVEVIIGVTTLKVLGNIFEHNDGGIFGTSRKTDEVIEGEEEYYEN